MKNLYSIKNTMIIFHIFIIISSLFIIVIEMIELFNKNFDRLPYFSMPIYILISYLYLVVRKRHKQELNRKPLIYSKEMSIFTPFCVLILAVVWRFFFE
jgi:hypothetical protein